MLVCWSGGCDSTLCLFDAAKRGPVRAISIEHESAPAGKEQYKARAALLNRMQPRCEPIHHKTITIRSDGSRVFDAYSAGGINQAALWIVNAQLFCLDSEDLCLGYVRGDDVWHYRQYLVEIWDRLRAITAKTGNLIFPLEWQSKAQVIGRLRDEVLLDLCWFCEAPRKGAACGRCLSCLTHQTGLQRLDLENGPLAADRKAIRKSNRRPNG